MLGKGETKECTLRNQTEIPKALEMLKNIFHREVIED